MKFVSLVMLLLVLLVACSGGVTSVEKQKQSSAAVNVDVNDPGIDQIVSDVTIQDEQVNLGDMI